MSKSETLDTFANGDPIPQVAVRESGQGQVHIGMDSAEVSQARTPYAYAILQKFAYNEVRARSAFRLLSGRGPTDLQKRLDDMYDGYARDLSAATKQRDDALQEAREARAREAKALDELDWRKNDREALIKRIEDDRIRHAAAISVFRLCSHDAKVDALAKAAIAMDMDPSAVIKGR